MKLIFLNFLIFTAIIAFSQSTNDYQIKIDSLNEVKLLLQEQINNLDVKIKDLEILKNNAWASQENGKIYVLVENGKIFNDELNTPIQVQKGTKVILIEKMKYNYKVLYNSQIHSVQTHLIMPLEKFEEQEKNKKLEDSLSINNAIPYIIIISDKLFYNPYNYYRAKNIEKGKIVSFVKNMEPKDGYERSMVLYNDSIYYCDNFILESLENYNNKILQEKEENKKLEAARSNKILQEKEEKKKLEAARIKRKQELINKFGTQNAIDILSGKIWIGMSKEMLLESWGRPKDINRTVTSTNVREQWVYESQYVYLENNIVTAWQD